jgi:hypothetical protein
MKKVMTTMVTVALLCGCSSLYKGIVSVTEIRDKAMTELAALNKQGKISAATDAKIAQADAYYRTSAEAAAKALIAYKTNGDKGQYVMALQAVKSAVVVLLDILNPMIPQTQASAMQVDLMKASVP